MAIWLRALLLRSVLPAVALLLSALIAVAAPARADDGDLVGSPGSYTTHYNDTLLDLARQYKLGIIELMAANPGVDPWLPGTNVHVTLPTMHILPDAPRRGIVMNVAELRLYYYGDPKNPVSYPIGIGRDGYLTPLGTTSVLRKKEKPSWYLTPSEIADHPELPKVIPPGPDNPLGDYALYLGWPAYLIHGTDVPWSIGRRASRGCIRMYPEDIEWMFQRVNPGVQVTVVDQPVKLGRRNGQLFIEVQPSPRQVDVMEETSKSPGPAEPIALAEWADRILVAAGPDIARLDWPALEQALAERQGMPVQITQGELLAESLSFRIPGLKSALAAAPAVAAAGGTAAKATNAGTPTRTPPTGTANTRAMAQRPKPAAATAPANASANSKSVTPRPAADSSGKSTRSPRTASN
jgi:L,D-transpeptidase ErfK/SrfK